MSETFSILPLSFWMVVALMVVGAFAALRRLRDGSGLPTLAVLGTVAAWYIGDALYNDYANYHARVFDPAILDSAWWQVVWFLVVFLLAAPSVHRWFNARFRSNSSGVFQMFKHGVLGQPAFQKQLNMLFVICACTWSALIVIGTIRLEGHFLPFLFPFLGGQTSPWGRGRLGTGFDSLLTVADYFQMLSAAIFGVVAALATNRRIRGFAFILCLIAWPYFIFDRTRNRMLTVAIPGVLSMVLLRMRGGLLKKAGVLAACFLVVNAWMGFVIANRSEMSITRALKEKGFSLTRKEKSHHEGLNMFEELCWINTFIKEGTYRPNWGSRYFAELVNVVPRSLWAGKPMIGIDYSIARGQGLEGGGAGVGASISTGLIGQGVVNFGRILGPAAAALIMSFWVAVLARLDLQINELGRLPLYFVGLILTFNTGRDITLITLYPFVFGYLTVRWLDRWHRSKADGHPLPNGHGQRGPDSSRPRVLIHRLGKRRAHGLAATLETAPRKADFPHSLGTSRDHL